MHANNNQNFIKQFTHLCDELNINKKTNIKQNKKLQHFVQLSEEKLSNLIESLKKNMSEKDIENLKKETETNFIEYQNEHLTQKKKNYIKNKLKQIKSTNQFLLGVLIKEDENKYNKLINTVKQPFIKSNTNSICYKGKKLQQLKLKKISKKEEKGVQTMIKFKKKLARGKFHIHFRGSKSSLEPIKEEYIKPNSTHKTTNILSQNNKKLKQIDYYLSMYNNNQSKKLFEYVLEDFKQINNTSNDLINKVDNSIHNIYSFMQNGSGSYQIKQAIGNITYDHLMHNKPTTNENTDIIDNKRYQELYSSNNINNNEPRKKCFAQLVIELLNRIQEKLNKQDINNKGEEEEKKEINNLENINEDQQIDNRI